MSKRVLFIQGGGNGGYKADAPLVASLQKALGTAYKVHYPQILPDETVPDFGQRWLQHIGKEISSAKSIIILVGHSLGASMLLKYLSENKIKKNIAGIFLIAHHFGAETKSGYSHLYCKKTFLISCQKISQFFSINARMMKWSHLITSKFISKIFPGQFFVKYLMEVTN